MKRPNRLVIALRAVLEQMREAIDARWCTYCGRRLVRRPDGHLDCPDTRRTW